jgi:hypothetical protein
MKRTLHKPLTFPRLGLSRIIRGRSIRQKVSPGKQGIDSIFSLAYQRCAGFTPRATTHKEKDY